MTSLCLHMGTGHPPAPFGPEGEISLVALIKHRILTTDLQTLRVLLLLATPGSCGERCKGHKPKSLVIVGLDFMKKKPIAIYVCCSPNCQTKDFILFTPSEKPLRFALTAVKPPHILSVSVVIKTFRQPCFIRYRTKS